MKRYETTVIATPVLSQEDYKQVIESYVDLLKTEGSEIVHVENSGLKQLAYPIRKKTSGLYFSVEFTTESQTIIDKLELAFRRDENIMRFLTVSLDKFAAKFNEDKRNGLIGKKRAKKEETTEKTEG